MAGDNLNLVWCNYRTGKREQGENIAMAIHRYGTGCPASGCIRCDFPGCFYAGFIREYWNCPGCD
jgi:hypothetical protein